MSTNERVQRLNELVRKEGVVASSRTVGGYLAWRLRGRPTKYDEYAGWMKAAEDVHPIGVDPEVGFTVIMPVYNTDPAYLSDAVESVMEQTHQQWQLILVDDVSTRGDTKRMAAQLASRDARISLITGEINQGIAGATNVGIEAAAHQWVAFMDHDDLLHRDALAWFSTCAAESDLIYSDEDKLDPSGRRHSPTWKPAWSSRLLLSINYINHLTAIRTEILRDVRRYSSVSMAPRITISCFACWRCPTCVPRISPLFSTTGAIWSESFSQSADSGLRSERSGLAAVADAITRRQWEADSTLSTGSPFNYRPRFRERVPRPTVKVVIPTRDRARLLQRCVSGV